MKNIATRKKTIIGAFMLGLVLFIMISPLSKWGYELVFAPAEPENIVVLQKNNEIEMQWDTNAEFDFSKYIIEYAPVSAEAQSREVEVLENSYLVSGLDNEQEYRFELYSVDQTGARSEPVVLDASPTLEINSFIANEDSNESELLIFILVVVSPLVIISMFFSFWIIFFKTNNVGVFASALFPTVTIFPFIILAVSVQYSINMSINQFIFASLVSLGTGLLAYILFLTLNIVNNSFYQKLPLEQAAKAVQFIISLISTYVMLLFVIGSDFEFVGRIAFIVPLIFYFSYLNLVTLKSISQTQVFVRSFSITLVLALLLVTLSIWPVNYIYSMLSIAVVFYILLSISIEIRSKLNRYVWVEYTVLVILVTLLLFSNSVWGINGTMI